MLRVKNISYIEASRASALHPRPNARRLQQLPRQVTRPQLNVSASASNTGFLEGGRPDPTGLIDGSVESPPTLSVEVNGLTLPNPFVIGSGPPGTNYAVMKKAFQEGWGGVISKTVSLDSSKVVNVTPRYAKLKGSDNKVLGWENIELISDRPFETMLSEFKRLKEEFPNRILIASIMEEYNRNAWEEIIGRCQETGVDAFEINFSCPHGMPERKMGMAMGQDCDLLAEVCGWINEAASIPVWAKMTPNVTDITVPAHAALSKGCEGVSAINTIQSIMGVDLNTLRPTPTVEGHTTPGGYSARAVKPIALARVMSIAQMQREGFPGTTLSGIGGVESGYDAAEFILLGANTVQVCTGVMLHGYPLVKQLCADLQHFMRHHGFSSIEEFRGAALPYVTTHTELVRMQREAIAQKKAKVGLANDDEWEGDRFVENAESMVSQ
uniref:dihydropyrimidine dehydrogenase (NADP(+)) n=1 Tax=Tetraselmis sp. GSL018 TaxID=582737 RepID=A0A061S405_9CHLO|eukprot:CAMPEP_0177597132 /NCGR_PEP_ID=MMETSP0419_2-20121207/11534_1 /TAXON_ID=582737 /ORGANISM="Tetraselmis sp., Strain GSL018" /LENGTH=439 /DNA_ID=CAMNT_0019089253 /DNA_START=212 /DNA_END=1531 /DNA_ORIENTATION=-